MGRMRRGIGPVHMMMFAGFAMGVVIPTFKSASGNSFIQIIGLLSLLIGIMGMVGKSPVKGPAGGLLTGLGLGITLGTFMFPA